ncbi:MAG: flagellar basal body P-ring formation protein FlgA, partial [Desulfobacula sp.]|nr:flagellar basal body P-ring formation protein FlgA [Desulfobacula sp.]
DENVFLHVPDKLYIKRLTQKLEIEYLKESFLKYVETFQENNKFDLRSFSVRGIEPYPQGELTIVFDRNNRCDGKGRFSIRVDILVENNHVDTLFVSGWVDVYERFVCARVPLLKNQKIDPQDLYYKNVNTSKNHQYYATKIENVEGKIPRNTIGKDGLIKTSLLERPPLVRRGDPIKLIAKRNGLIIITAGISKEDGIADDLIRVENLSSGKIVRGYVKGKSKVEVYN